MTITMRQEKISFLYISESLHFLFNIFHEP